MRKYHMNCACEHGQPCTRVAACFVEEIVGDLAREIEMKAEDDHAALISKVREIAEEMLCSLDCDSRRPGHMVGGISFDVNEPPRAREVKRKCTCPRGKLLALCEVK